jgi:hypothetical protein
MCVLIFSTILSETFLILRRIQRDVIINACRCSCDVPLFLSDCSGVNILHKFSNPQILNFLKICRVATQLLHANGRAGGQMERDDVAVGRFSQFSVCA